jgi:hypothetical protein
VSVSKLVQPDQVDALTIESTYDDYCYECGRGDLGFLCCAACGTELARRPADGERLCALCAVASSREVLSRILTGNGVDE